MDEAKAKDRGARLLGEALLDAIRQAVKEAVVEAVREAKADNDKLLTAEQAAALLNLPESWIREAARRGKLDGAVRFGHYWRFHKHALLRCFEQQQKPRR